MASHNSHTEGEYHYATHLPEAKPNLTLIIDLFNSQSISSDSVCYFFVKAIRISHVALNPPTFGLQYCLIFYPQRVNTTVHMPKTGQPFGSLFFL